MKQLQECPICGHRDLSPVRESNYFRGNQEKFSIAECAQCHFWMTNPQPEEGPELAAYYETEDYVSHTEQQEGLVDRVYLAVRRYALKRKKALIDSLVKSPGRLLDFGAGTGAFLEVARAGGWQVEGREPSTLARKKAAEKGIELQDPAMELPQGTYDVISLWHVLEHLPNLQKDLRRLTQALRKGGHLVIAVPNHESLDATLYGNKWAAFDVPLHLWHFKKKNIRDLAAQHQLSVRAIKNMPFDSFYVSMLSEQNSGQGGGLLRAFYRGLRSNLAGSGTPPNMSSLIYILEKR